MEVRLSKWWAMKFHFYTTASSGALTREKPKDRKFPRNLSHLSSILPTPKKRDDFFISGHWFLPSQLLPAMFRKFINIEKGDEKCRKIWNGDWEMFGLHERILCNKMCLVCEALFLHRLWPSWNCGKKEIRENI